MPDCVYQEGESWELLHKDPAEVLNFGGAEGWNFQLQDSDIC